MSALIERRRAAEHGYTVEELWLAVRRRARASLVVFAIALAVGLAIVAMSPREYRAEVAIVLEPYRPHVELVTPAVTGLLEDRLRVARQQLLAGSRLEELVRTNDVFQSWIEESGVDGAVDRLRRQLEIKPDGDSAILVAYRSHDPESAAAVVRAVAQGFVDANTEMRVGQAHRVVDAIVQELDRVTKSLDGKEQEVRAFRTAHDGELPEQLDANLREAERATHLLVGSTGWLHEIERRRADLPTQETTPEIQRLALVEAELVRQLNHARALFSDDHPETIRIGRELEGARTLALEASAKAESTRRDRAAVERDLRRARDEVSSLERSAKEARERAAAAPRWASELTVLERDRDLLREKYRSLMSRRVEAEVSLSLEEHAAPLATQVIEPGGIGAAPSGPDRTKLSTMALLAAIAIAVAWGVFLESRDSSLRTPAEARERLPVPLLSVVPDLRTRT